MKKKNIEKNKHIEMKIILQWSEPINIKTIEYQRDKQEFIFRGIYIWGFRIENEFMPYYVGIAEDILYRILEHVSLICGGRYCIHNQHTINEFYKYKNEEKAGEKVLYIPDWPYGYNKFIENFRSFQPHVLFMIENLEFSYAIVNEDIDLKEIETIIIHQIGKENLWNLRAGIITKKLRVVNQGAAEIINFLKI
jgi:hypothetical protein